MVTKGNHMITDMVPLITHRSPPLNTPRAHHPSVETILALAGTTPIRVPTVVSPARVPLRATTIELHIWMTIAISTIHNGQHRGPVAVLGKTAQERDTATDPKPLPRGLHLPMIHNLQGQWIVVTISDLLLRHSQEKRIMPRKDPKAMVHETCLRLPVMRRPQPQQRTVERSASPSKPRAHRRLLPNRYPTSHSVCKSANRHPVLLLYLKYLPLAIV
jgi:hypothetical protein